MNTTSGKIVNKRWLETKINYLNQWLTCNPTKSAEQWQNEHNRNYYVNKLIELEENGFKMIQI